MADDPNNLTPDANDNPLPEEPNAAAPPPPDDVPAEPPDADGIAKDEAPAEAAGPEVSATDEISADAGETPAAPPPTAPAADGVNTFTQEELDALSAQVAELGGEPPTTPAPKNTFDQSELDALAAELAEANDPAAAAPTSSAADAAAEQQVDDLAAEMAAAIAAEAAAAEDASPAEPKVVGEVRVTATPTAAQAFQPPELGQETVNDDKFASIDMLDDVELDVKIELGRTDMYIEDVLRLGVGSVVELDKLAGDPVDIFVNDKLIARGEVLVLNDNFCVRINDIHSPIPELEQEE